MMTLPVTLGDSEPLGNSDNLEYPWRSFPYCKPAYCLSSILL